MKTILYIFGAIVGLGILAFAYYALSPLFVSTKVDEAVPEAPRQEQESVTQTVTSSPVMGTVGHPASGTARVVEVDGATYIRYENFKTINGPDLYVYLAKDRDAKDFINLGTLRATEGNVNYQVPAGVNISDYHYVLVWCKAFGVLFNYADLASAQ